MTPPPDPPLLSETTEKTPDFTLTPEQERDVLDFDPWGERDATYRTLRSGFARCRKAYRCDICFGSINAGERVWAKTEQDDGTVATFRFCAECCWCDDFARLETVRPPS